MISAAQKVEHYEMASYGCLHEWAGLLENEKAADLLEDILDEEKATNEKLTELARASSNAEALAETGPDASSEDDENLTENTRPTKGRKLAEVSSR